MVREPSDADRDFFFGGGSKVIEDCSRYNVVKIVSKPLSTRAVSF